MQYDLALLTDTNSVICKIIVGTKPPLCKGRRHGEAVTEGLQYTDKKQSPSQKSKISASPLYTRGPYQPQKRRKRYYEGGRYRPSGGGIWYNRTNIEKPHKHQGLRWFLWGSICTKSCQKRVFRRF